MKANYKLLTRMQRLIQRQPPSIQMQLKSLSWCQSAPLIRKNETPAGKEIHLMVIHHKDHSRHATFHGLSRCHNLWSCPVCAARELAFQVERLTEVIQRRRADGYVAKMITLTIPHRASETAQALLDEIKRCKVKFGKRLAHIARDYGVTFGGSITSCECKHSKLYGWHFHFHYALFIREDQESRLAADGDVGAALKRLWQEIVTNLTGKDVSEEQERRSGSPCLYISNKPLNDAKYLAKELAKGDNKKKFSRSPFELLASDDEGDKRLFLEYALATRRRARIYVSAGLNKGIDMKAVKKKVLADTSSSTEWVCSWSLDDWSSIQGLEFDGCHWSDTHCIRLALLKAAELDGYSGVIEVCTRFDLPYPRRVGKTARVDVDILELVETRLLGEFGEDLNTAEPYTVTGDKYVTTLQVPAQLPTLTALPARITVQPDEIYTEEEWERVKYMRAHNLKSEKDLQELSQMAEGLF